MESCRWPRSRSQQWLVRSGAVCSPCVCVYVVCGVFLRKNSEPPECFALCPKTRSERISILLDGVSGLHSVACQASIAQRPIRLRGLPRSVTSQDQAERPDWKTCVRISRFAIKLSLPIKSRHLRPFIVITSNWFNRYSWSYEKPLNGSIRVSQDSTGYSSNRFPLPATLPSSLLVRGSLLAFVLGRLASSSGKEPEPLLHLQSVPRRRILHCGSTSQIVAVLLERELTRL